MKGFACIPFSQYWRCCYSRGICRRHGIRRLPCACMRARQYVTSCTAVLQGARPARLPTHCSLCRFHLDALSAVHEPVLSANMSVHIRSLDVCVASWANLSSIKLFHSDPGQGIDCGTGHADRYQQNNAAHGTECKRGAIAHRACVKADSPSQLRECRCKQPP